jgi:hypothetical protein
MKDFIKDKTRGGSAGKGRCSGLDRCVETQIQAEISYQSGFIAEHIALYPQVSDAEDDICGFGYAIELKATERMSNVSKPCSIHKGNIPVS